jgi:HTH-type transcriptional repressor of NAD biosynthesis genes
MAKSFVLMTAMPPTTGHLQLVQFANLLANDGVVLIICTQPFEPFVHERIEAMQLALDHAGLNKVTLQHIDKTMEQDPTADGFWDMWREILVGYGITKDDYVVSSETYGKKLAEITGAQFFPYDIERSINPVKATPIRDDPLTHFDDIIPEFRKFLTTTVTVFGAESTGKTTLARALAKELRANWLFEYARPYLENTENVITVDSMTGIWKGQKALQQQAENVRISPFILQDTDLFSTVGYWEFPHWQSIIGACPDGLIKDAVALQSDLYIVTRSNIAFEPDPLRYGGDKREGSDEYWIAVLEKYHLPYVILEASDMEDRIQTAVTAIKAVADKKAKKLFYDRKGL